MLLDSGNAFKMENGILLSAALLQDGSIDQGEWVEVDFYSIDPAEKTYCMAIRSALVAQESR